MGAEVYNPEGFSLQIFKDRYAIHPEETFSQACERIARTIADAELGSKRDEYFTRFLDIMQTNRFSPGGRIWRGAGRPRGQLMNCFCSLVEDSREGWGDVLRNVTIISGMGGGVGISFSKIRPRGTQIRGTGGEATGSVSLMKMINAVCNELREGGNRRSALLFCLKYDHPDLMEFLEAKLDNNELNNANISVCIDDVFLKLLDNQKDVVFKWQGEERRKVSAQIIWDKIIENAWKNGDPGILNMGLINEQNTLSYVDGGEIVSTNPCFTGDTMVAVADGRVAVPICKLAKENNDVPVYCRKPDGALSIRMMRNPRISGYKQKIIKVIIEGNHKIKVTENHKFTMVDGSIKLAKHLKSGDSLSIMTKLEAPFEYVLRHSSSKSQNYYWLNNSDQSRWILDHRLIANFHNKPIGHKQVVHHKNGNGIDNNPANLHIMTKQEHDNYHLWNMVGDNNPMRRWYKNATPQEKKQYQENMSASVSGDKNGNYSGITNKQLFDFTVKQTRKNGHRLTQSEYQNLAKQHGMPSTFSGYRERTLGNLNLFLENAAIEADVDSNRRSACTVREYKKFLTLDTDLDIFFDICIKVNKKCEYCGKDFIVTWGKREICFCSHICGIQNTAKRDDVKLKIKQYRISQRIIKRQQLLSEYLKYKNQIGRIPIKREFQDYCSSNGISFRLPVKNEIESGKFIGAFRSWNDLKEQALTHNHKVIKIEECGEEDVYNGTVDEYHNFYVGHFEEKHDKYTKFLYVNTLQCGEATLENYGACCLGSINLHTHIVDGKIDWDMLEETIAMGVRFLDNVLDQNNFPLPIIQETSQKHRRIGLGIMGLHDMLLELDLKYSTQAARDVVDNVMDFIKKQAYHASITLAIEKGSFHAFDIDQHNKTGFIKKHLGRRHHRLIKEHGLRNCALLCIAPTGTTSIVAGCSSGLEPLFQPVYERRFNQHKDMHDNKKRDEAVEIIVHPLLRQFIEENRSTKNFQGAHDISPEAHLAMQEVCQKHIDNSISKTINIPSDYPVEKLSAMIMKSIRELKGITIYRDGSRGKSPLTPLPISEAKKHLSEIKEQASVDECPSGACDTQKGGN